MNLLAVGFSAFVILVPFVVPIFGTTFECPCGRVHAIQPERILYDDQAIEHLPSVLPPPPLQLASVMDVRTRQAAGRRTSEVLRQAGYDVQEIVLEDSRGRSPVCDEATRAWIEARIGQPRLMVACGSGVVNDLVKWIAGDAALPYVSVATAASMNGYTSANVAPTLAGVKSLVRSAPARVVASTPAILRDAPYAMTAAGLGDVLAKSVSSADWFLNHRLFGDYYCPKAVGLIARIEPLYLRTPQAIRRLEPGALAAIFQALLLTGAAMTMAESSAPASGGEHAISHALDMMSSLDERPHDLHGRQVGVGTILASELYRRVLAIESPRFVAPPGGIDRAFWGSSAMADAVEAEYRKKLPRLREASRLPAQGLAWDRLREELAGMARPPETVRDCLREAGAAWRAEDLGCDRPRLRAALLHAHEIRSRCTILDLARLLGIMPAAAEELVERWA